MSILIPSNLLSRQMPDGISARRVEDLLATKTLEGYLCATIWDWEEERKKVGSTEPLSIFTIEMQVPEPPIIVSNQTIFLFNGLQPSGADQTKAVLQPVVQWGNPNVLGGGPFWSVSSWFVQGQPGDLKVFARTESTRVDPGTTVKSQIKLISSSDGIFNYSCEFIGIKGTTLNIAIPTELVLCTTALEVYHVSDNEQLPASSETKLSNVTILVENERRVSPIWEVRNFALTASVCVTVASHNSIEDEVEFQYRSSNNHLTNCN